MKLQGIYNSLCERKHSGKKSFAVLVDPDKVDNGRMHGLVELALRAKIDYFLVGGSLVVSNYIVRYRLYCFPAALTSFPNMLMPCCIFL
jgi:heptaprenylglyceryl phosphate synthase